MTIIEALILGIIQGLTEFLPVSSSGHIELGKILLGVQAKENLLFSILVHGATALSTIIVFRKDIFQIIKNGFKFPFNDYSRFIIYIIISIIPVMIIGLLFEEQIESLFTGNALLVGSMLILTGLLLLFASFTGNPDGDLSPLKALIIGIAQAIAILPGISRSGATIGTALLLKVNREQAARFSFLMVLIPILGAAFLKTLDLFSGEAENISNINVPAMAIGAIAAFGSGLVACNWMIKIVKQGKLIFFAGYCFLAGIIAIIGAFIQS
ncbi:undecaprenyl-diphosphate phosphatase [Marinigracilibium pacificum]|uniref:Undecaprenyl-diphosphatase n=1 Tax=Marinigracilibium pacificum TaxID=2729599 RepID=A0A848J4A4_9BACT|nr:undecaprenyl-diphosphate phosphatase [Marinigracilibium pacificum]NMM48002.1 undecaprenyl-diphosphate phosphatase [Marinigracilibium pacificum]